VFTLLEVKSSMQKYILSSFLVTGVSLECEFVLFLFKMDQKLLSPTLPTLIPHFVGLDGDERRGEKEKIDLVCCSPPLMLGAFYNVDFFSPADRA